MNGIYIHIPFCKRKCNYCDFCSYAEADYTHEEYAKRVCEESDNFKDENICADTVYFGGGTPTLLDEKYIESILVSLKDNFHISSDAEITIEANPCTVTKEKMKNLHSVGFNRVSLGVQSFSDTVLKTLGRLHSSDDVKRSAEKIRNAGFSNLNIDLMYAVPGQSFEDLSTSLSEVLKISPEHISAYGLKIEEGTPFYSMVRKGEISEMSDDDYADMYEQICKTLTNHGYNQYELSNFSKKGMESKHNLKYWQGEDYIGLGAAASSRIGLKRYTRSPNLSRYMKSFSNDEEIILTRRDAMSEYMFMGLRLTSLGVSKAAFKQKFSVECYDVFTDAIDKHTKNGLLKDLGDRYILANEAFYISNYVLCDFV